MVRKRVGNSAKHNKDGQSITLEQAAENRNCLLTVEQTAQLIGLKKSALDRWRSEKRNGLPFIRVGRRIRYRVSDVLAWLETRTEVAGA